MMHWGVAVRERILPERLRRIREIRGLTLDQAASQIGVARTTLHGYESGRRNPDPETIRALARAYGTTAAYLLGESDNPHPPRLPSLQETITAIGGMPLKPIPILGVIHAGASNWATEIPEGWTAIPVEQARGGEFFALRVRGDCFAAGPRPLYDGDVVIVRAQERVENGQAAIVLWPEVNEAQIRRVYVHGDQVTLTADNPAYPPITVATADVRILGLVVGYQAELAAAREQARR